MKYVDEFRSEARQEAIRREIAARAAELPRPVRLMEVCGSHTMAAARFGIRNRLPENLTLLSGPGCPVCVTPAGYLDAAMAIAGRGATVCTFGDMLKVPGSDGGNLADCRAAGGRIEVVYSPEAALELARNRPTDEVVFLAVGFETTTAVIMAVLALAEAEKIANFSLLCSFKTMPPALNFLVESEAAVDGYLLPPHVSSIIGAAAYDELAQEHGVPGAICGFEPVDLYAGIAALLEMLTAGRAAIRNCYARAVRPEGNRPAQKLMARFLEVCDAGWRGLGTLPASGLKLKESCAGYDAAQRFGVDPTAAGRDDPRCRCGEVLTGRIRPEDCPVFGRVCTPEQPVGACMVSGEGACAAAYKYAEMKA